MWEGALGLTLALTWFSGPVEVKPEDEDGSAIDDLLASSASVAPRDVPRGQDLFDYGEDEQDDDDDMKPETGAPAARAQFCATDGGADEKKVKPALEMHYQGRSTPAPFRPPSRTGR